MANSNKDLYDISYSIKVGPSIYHVLARRTKNPKYKNAYFHAEDTTFRSRSANIFEKPSTDIQRTKSRRQSTSSGSRPKTNHNCTINTDIDLINKSHQQQQKSNEIHHCSRRYIQSKSKRTNPTIDKMIKNKMEMLPNLVQQEIPQEKLPSVKANQNERRRFLKSTINNQTQEITRLFKEQYHTLVHLLEQHILTMKSSSTDIMKQILIDSLKSQQHIFTKEFEHSLIQTFQQELQKTCLKTDDNKPQSTSFDTNTITQLQDIFTQTIEKYIASTIIDQSNTLNHLFSEQKQVLIDALSEQQCTSFIDLIKQALTDAPSEFNSTSITTYTTNYHELNTEIEITADLRQTRIDIAFRQQRDTIVANRYLRDNVRQWSNIRSILSLIKKIQECGTNDLEYAWLLYCWIGKNIRYDQNCSNNSSECVFQNRIGYSHGFVSLYHKCCSLLNIQCLQISGYIKQNETSKLFSHIWNGIIIDEYIYLIDPTWAAGGRDNTNRFEDFYFLISPEKLIYTHYSKDYQLLQPKLTKHDFINLPIIKSNYLRLNLNLLKPKQNFNQITENLFQISLQIPAYVDLIISLQINNIEYPSHLHTLCQYDIVQTDIINCFLAPPTNGLYDIIIYTKTNNEIKYQETISMKLNVINMFQAITFPIRSQLFSEYKCILIEPFRRLLKENEYVLIHIKIPDALAIKIKNGNEVFLVNQDEYQNGFLKKQIYAHGDIHICARWNERTEKISTICIFNMI